MNHDTVSATASGWEQRHVRESGKRRANNTSDVTLIEKARRRRGTITRERERDGERAQTTLPCLGGASETPETSSADTGCSEPHRQKVLVQHEDTSTSLIAQRGRAITVQMTVTIKSPAAVKSQQVHFT